MHAKARAPSGSHRRRWQTRLHTGYWCHPYPIRPPMRASFSGFAREFHQREMFAISGRAFNRRFDCADHVEADTLRELDDPRDCFAPEFFIPDDAPLADLALADFELRLYQRDYLRARCDP